MGLGFRLNPEIMLPAVRGCRWQRTNMLCDV